MRTCGGSWILQLKRRGLWIFDPSAPPPPPPHRHKVTNIPPLLENGVFVTNYQTKADVFNEFFAKQCSLLPNNSFIPAFTPKCDKISSSVGIDRSKVLSLIRFLDSKKAHVMICPSLC